jgi:hypothetical protein
MCECPFSGTREPTVTNHKTKKIESIPKHSSVFEKVHNRFVKRVRVPWERNPNTPAWCRHPNICSAPHRKNSNKLV